MPRRELVGVLAVLHMMCTISIITFINERLALPNKDPIS